ncbi:archaellin/type IV pilin N-terminal domain-containing protein [Halobiforma nitratireducens]|uniref:Flagellin n=1 Tax=Halobiforma nitratireducens JCM 10879 TaxID=1227454 RepID=M0LK61_9EURY|nr:archaellin/type IV pilin N-terminal domain-containing protein [Halobiforma nitratireducens]EMA32400.1 flagellin A1 [Halobiforma nitratireducens JCM 10879]
MFERVTDEEERGQVGIGTLIVFIAMVLVAAIAAVLINTAGLLQSQAEATGQESTAQVSNVVQIDSATGNVAEPDDHGTLEDNVVITIVDDHSLDIEEVSLDNNNGLDENVDTSGSDGESSSVDLSDNNEVEIEVDGTPSGDFDDEIVLQTEVEITEENIDGDQEVEITLGGEESDNVDLEEITLLQTDHHVDTASMMVSLGPGSDPVDLKAATFEFVGDDTERGTADELDDLDIYELSNGESYTDDTDFDAILESDTQLEIELDLTGDDDFSPIQSGEDAEFLITTADGSQTVELLMAPSTLTETSAVTL